MKREFAANRRHFFWKVSEMFLTYRSASSVPLGDVTPVLFLHRMAESVSPPNLIHLRKEWTAMEQDDQTFV